MHKESLNIKKEVYIVIRQKEAYKKMHPEQFSDSKIVKKGKLERELLDFYLETLTSKNMEKQFEELCRSIAEVEICPNLLPQTGPTGGGDSKVDSETYPVAEELSEMWYSGVASKASRERWAFAISAKKDWKPKVKSDVKKIVGVNDECKRGYSKIFFMSNQYIPDKKRAQCEDELRTLYDIDVRILDRTWMLDKIFSSPSNVDIAITALGLSESFADAIEIGERDLKRKKRLDEIEKRLINTNTKNSEKVHLVLEAVVLAREIESPEDKTMGLIERCIRISKKYGTKVEIAKAYSTAAWTIYWWYLDPNLYYEYYQEYERRTIEEHNVHLFTELIALWINLNSLVVEGTLEIDIEKHKLIVQNEYKIFISDQTKPNTALEARAAYIPFRIITREKTEDIIKEMFELLDESTGHLDLDLKNIQRIIMEFPEILESNQYDALFEKMITVSGKRKQDTDTAYLLAERASKLMDNSPYEAISYFSRTLIPFYNEQNKDNLCNVVFSLALIFEKCGLYWAARNYYYYVFCVCLNQYFKFAEVSPFMYKSTSRLKYLELRLGHILYSIEFSDLERISTEIYPDKCTIDEETQMHYDFAVALLLLQDENPKKEILTRLPSYLEMRGLDISSIVVRYLLGHYDKDMLEELNNDKNKYDATILEWRNSPASKEFLDMIWYGTEDTCKLHSRLLGCDLMICYDKPYNSGGYEIAATILATLESFLGTGINNDLISMCGSIDIFVKHKDNMTTYIEWEKKTSNSINVYFSDYRKEDFLNVQQQLSVFLTELIGVIISMMFPFEEALHKIEKMVMQEAALDRTFIFSNSVVFGMETMGKEMFLFENILDGVETFQSEGDVIILDKVATTKEKRHPLSISIGLPPEGKSFVKTLAQKNIKTQSVIDIDIWNRSDWKGVMFMADVNNHSFPPILAFIFNKNDGCEIFQKWIDEFGACDNDNRIAIRIVKKIDSENLYHYRLIVGSEKIPMDEDVKIVASPARVHTMTPPNDNNITMFERELERSDSFFICPAIMERNEQYPKVYESLKIKKSKQSIKICNAWEIPENDLVVFSGILPTDQPFIPEGKEDAFILKIIEMHKNMNK